MDNKKFADNIITLIKCTKEAKDRLQKCVDQETEKHKDEYHPEVMKLDKEHHEVCMAELTLFEMLLCLQDTIVPKEAESTILH